MVHVFRLLLVTLFLTLAGSSGGQALTLENRAGEKSVVAPELSSLESPQAVPTHQENGRGYDELAADRLSFQSEDPIADKIRAAMQVQPFNPFTALVAAAGSSSNGSPNATSEMQPTAFTAGDFNISRYVGNSPLNYTDPAGLDDASEYVLVTSRIEETETGFRGFITLKNAEGDVRVYEIANEERQVIVATFKQIIKYLNEGEPPP